MPGLASCYPERFRNRKNLLRACPIPLQRSPSTASTTPTPVAGGPGGAPHGAHQPPHGAPEGPQEGPSLAPRAAHARGSAPSLLDYLRRNDVERYRALIAKLGLRR
jgi:hypothetical protein